MLIRDNYQNFKSYQLPKAQLIIADVPYNVGSNAYGSNPSWYIDGDNKNGASEKAGKQFFNTDINFKPAEFMHFCSQMLRKEPKERNQAPCMILFCAFDQQFYFIELAKKYGLTNYINLVFRKNFSAQVLKANMRIVGNCEYGLLLYRDNSTEFNDEDKIIFNTEYGLLFYRDKLPKFRNYGKMQFNCIDWERDDKDVPKIHPTQKPVKLLEKIINLFTDEGDVVLDPCAGSGSTLIAALRNNRKAFGFEIDREIYSKAKEWIDSEILIKKEIEEYGFAKTEIEKDYPSLF